ncbi:hypothetical protein HYFRA_00008548 [Hymenoscyphus fraxineus]|uniref:Histidine kinase n=1 Tax=Hymenoscyphus fraxineus TaxID=746836 RepID=A0A9N9PUT8_9HELO|nr:hypothetical protein HYFRA_00008548 [Hymenoscyphus fraxineus]
MRATAIGMALEVLEAVDGRTSTAEDTAALPTGNLEFTVLLRLPTPTLVLSSSGTAVVANDAIRKLLGSPSPTLSSKELYGYSPGELGLELVPSAPWQTVLEDFDEEYSAHQEKGLEREGPTHEITLAVSGQSRGPLRAELSGCTYDGKTYFIISVERPATFSRPVGNSTLTPEKECDVSFHQENIGSLKDKGCQTLHYDSFRIRNAVFENREVPGYLISVDENEDFIFIFNRKSRDIFGDIMDGDGLCDGRTFYKKLPLWDKHFTRQLSPAEYPGVRLAHSQVPFIGYECGFIHTATGQKMFASIDAECLYDETTKDFLGGVVWLRELQAYSKLNEQQMPTQYESKTSDTNLPHLLWTHTASNDDIQYRLTDRWCEFTGLDKSGRPGDAIHPNDLPHIMAKWFHNKDSRTEYSHEVRFRRHDGIYRWMLLAVYPISKRNQIWAATISDIHDSVQGRSKEQVLKVLSQTDVMIFTIDKNLVITLAEGGTNTDLAPRPCDLVGREGVELCQEATKGAGTEFQKNARDILSGRLDMAYFEDIVGDKIYRVKLVVDLDHNTLDEDGKPTIRGVMGLRTDVTDIKKIGQLEVENARLAAEEQAAKASNELKSRFLANVSAPSELAWTSNALSDIESVEMSHELRTPAAGVIGMVELLSEDPTLTPEQREYVASIQLSGKALLSIVNDILDFSKIESGRLDIEEVPFHLSAIVGELCKLLSMFAQQKGIQFIHESSIDEELEFLGDPGRIRQILTNLLTNALKFTKEGWVKISVSGTSRKEESGEVVDVIFSIEDTGIGIDKDVLNKLFRPFSQGDSSTARLFGGTGLGLTISRNLAGLMSGTISLESDTSSGSTATFMVPLKVSPSSKGALVVHRKFSESKHYDNNLTKIPSWIQPLAHREKSQELINQAIGCSDTQSFTSSAIIRGDNSTESEHPPMTLTPEQRKEIQVLVVEDNAINQLIACRNIRRLGFSVTAVWNGLEALSYLRQPSSSQPRPDIILMDVQMPVMDGYEATNHLRTKAEYAVTPPMSPPVTPLAEGDPDMQFGESSKKTTIEMSVCKSENINERRRGPLSEIVVVAMTASCIQGDKEKCTNAGMDDYLAKPVDKERLEEMLVKWACKMRR